ncbi:WD40 repeat domain-containing protein [Tautonia rosea]|uniref:WD40 repeat domain-containing protein n=1 Tax=Tautonia rosea TaxID=2728037 RepID=UPI001472A8AB|nr:WD40 repeat domain-containing protein [Tautonia rosea]
MSNPTDASRSRSGSWSRGIGVCPTLAVLLALGAAVAVPLLQQPQTPRSQIMLPENGLVSSVAFNTQGDRIYSDHKALGPTVLQLGQEGKLYQEPSVGLGRCSLMTLDPSGQSLFVARESGAIEVRDAESFDLRQTLPGPSRSLSLAVSTDGQRLISVDPSNVCRCWSLTEQNVAWQYSEQSGISQCTFSPDGRFVILGFRHGEIAVLDASTGVELTRWDGHGYGALLLALAFTPDGQTLVSVGLEGRLRTWDALKNWEMHHDISMPGGTSRSLAIAPDGQTLATGHNDGYVRVWDLSTGSLLGEAAMANIQLSSVCFAPGGQQLAVSYGSTVALISTPGSV